MQSNLKIPKKRIAMIIGKGGNTKRMLTEKGGCKSIHVDSKTGDVTINWGEPGSFDPLMMMKVPDVIKAIGRAVSYTHLTLPTKA